MTYPFAFRQKVLSIRREEGYTIQETSLRFGIGIATLTRWLKQPEPKRTKRRPSLKINLRHLAEDIRIFPDAYHHERAQRLQVSATGIRDAMKRLGVTYKKALRHPKADDDKRRCFQQTLEAHKLEGKPFVYIDESGFAHDMPRTHGYAPKGKRRYGVHNWGAKGRTNVIGALLAGVMLTTWLCDFNIDSDVFHKWTTEDLLPKLPPGSVVIMDNAIFHKRADTQKAIKDAGHTLENLPPYSPDLDPIEQKWAHAKAKRRKTGASTEQIFSREA